MFAKMDTQIHKTPFSLLPEISQLEIDKELTNKFLRGELSFTEYSAEWYGKDLETPDISETVLEKPTSGQSSTNSDATIRRRKRTHLTPALLGLMGEANLRYVRGDRQLAEKMCHEIIRQVPNASEPYQTLAQIYETDPDKSLQFTLLAAHLNPSDAEEWIRLANVSKERGDVKQEMLCYTKAINADPKCLSFHMKRIELLHELEKNEYPIYTLNLNLQKCYSRLVATLTPNEGEAILKYAKLAASLYHSDGDLEKAFDVMHTAYEKCANIFTMEDLNLYLELLISQKKYHECLNVLVCKAGVEIEADAELAEDDKVEGITNIIDCILPDKLPIDLKTKLLICFIYLNANRLVEEMIKSLLAYNVEDAGDLYLDVEEALTNQGHHELALCMLEPLVHSQKYSLGAVWLKHAQCLEALSRMDDAIMSYKQVIQLAPQHLGARRKLCQILKEKNRLDEAFEALEQNVNEHTLDVGLMYEQCMMLKAHMKITKYLEVGQLLLSRHLLKIRSRNEIRVARLRVAHENLKTFRSERGENPDDDDEPNFDNDTNKLTVEQEWELFLDLVETAKSNCRYPTLQRLCISGLGSKKFSQHRHRLEYMALLACYWNRDFFHSYTLVRDLIHRYQDKSRIWNIFNFIVQCSDDNRHNKFLIRSSVKQNTGYYIELLHGNNFLTSGRYRVAIKYYAKSYKRTKDPLSILLLGVTLLLLGCQRFIDKHHSLILQGISCFFTYKVLRGTGSEQEVFFNIGRAFHLLSLFNLAIHYYEKALSCTINLGCEHNDYLNLQQEIAFNLHLIYKKHSPNVARMYLCKYIVI